MHMNIFPSEDFMWVLFLMGKIYGKFILLHETLEKRWKNDDYSSLKSEIKLD